MLRITIKEEELQTVFLLEGSLAGGWVKELETCWRQSKPQVVELVDVRYVDRRGLRLLECMAFEGAKLVARDLLMRSIVEAITSEIAVIGDLDELSEVAQSPRVS